MCRKDPKTQIDEISGKFALNGTLEEAKMCLRATNIIESKVCDDSENSFPCLGTSSSYDNSEAIAEVERVIDSEEHGGICLPKKNNVKTPLPSGCQPEVDPSRELDDHKRNCHWDLTGVLRWTCKSGRLDILQPVSSMLRHFAQA